MPWTHDGISIKEGRSWTSSKGIVHPKNWGIWSDDYKKEMGLVWKDEENTYFDGRFYYAKSIEKKLTDTKEVDDDGKAIIDAVTGKQMVTLGLKSIWTDTIKKEANSLLSNSDWYITRKSEKNIEIPSSITTYRDKVRTAANNIENLINQAENLSEFMKLFDVPVDSDGIPTGKSPITNWPDE